MPAIRELREQHGRRSGESAGFVSLIVGTVAAFGVGALLVVGWQMLPGMIGAPGKAAPTFAAAGKRLGIAARAPVLAQCMSVGGAGSGGEDLTPAGFYALLQMNNRAMGIARIASPQLAAVPNDFSMAWGEIADCVYRQNGRALCEPNNRALAVEAAINVVREVDGFAKAQPALNSIIERRMSRLGDIQDRVLTGLRAQLRDGRLIAADFGYVPPTNLKRVLQDAMPTRNGCAEDGLGG